MIDIIYPIYPAGRIANLSKIGSCTVQLAFDITVWLLKIDLTHPMSLCSGLAKREAEEAKIP